MSYNTPIFASDLKMSHMKNKVNRALVAKKRLLIMTVIVTSMVAVASCNVTRVVTNESKYTTRGDTAVVITTKTVETYDASKR